MVPSVRRFFGGGEKRGGNYPYVTARVRALKTHLLAKEEYPKLIARDLHAIARTLEEGRYKQEIDELASKFSGAELIERATRLNMGREFQRILDWCKGEPEVLIGHYLQRYTIYNMKTLLRGAQAGASAEETETALIPAGVVSMNAWAPALGVTSVAECLDALPTTEYTGVLREMEDARLSELENALDIAYYEHLIGTVPASSRANEAFLSFLRREIDTVNLKLVLRTKHADVASYQLVPGGKELTEDRARRIQTADWSEVSSILDETSFGDGLRDALEAYQETRDLNNLTSAIESFHLDEAEGFSHLYPLSILPIVDYVLRKELEVDNLRMIAFGKQAGLEKRDVEALVTTI